MSTVGRAEDAMAQPFVASGDWKSALMLNAFLFVRVKVLV